jgi:hypothetical protein
LTLSGGRPYHSPDIESDPLRTDDGDTERLAATRDAATNDE